MAIKLFLVFFVGTDNNNKSVFDVTWEVENEYDS